MATPFDPTADDLSYIESNAPTPGAASPNYKPNPGASAPPAPKVVPNPGASFMPGSTAVTRTPSGPYVPGASTEDPNKAKLNVETIYQDELRQLDKLHSERPGVAADSIEVDASPRAVPVIPAAMVGQGYNTASPVSEGGTEDMSLPPVLKKIQTLRSEARDKLSESDKIQGDYEAAKVAADTHMQQAAQAFAANRKAQADMANEQSTRRLADIEAARADAAQQFDGQRFWKNPASIGTAIGAALMAWGRKPELAMKMMDDAVARDMESQKQEIQGKHQKVNELVNSYQMHRNLIKDKDEAELAFEKSAWENYQSQVKIMGDKLKIDSAPVANAIRNKILEINEIQQNLADDKAHYVSERLTNEAEVKARANAWVRLPDGTLVKKPSDTSATALQAALAKAKSESSTAKEQSKAIGAETDSGKISNIARGILDKKNDPKSDMTQGQLAAKAESAPAKRKAVNVHDLPPEYQKAFLSPGHEWADSKSVHPDTHVVFTTGDVPRLIHKSLYPEYAKANVAVDGLKNSLKAYEASVNTYYKMRQMGASFEDLSIAKQRQTAAAMPLAYSLARMRDPSTGVKDAELKSTMETIGDHGASRLGVLNDMTNRYLAPGMTDTDYKKIKSQIASIRDEANNATDAFLKSNRTEAATRIDAYYPDSGMTVTKYARGKTMHAGQQAK